MNSPSELDPLAKRLSLAIRELPHCPPGSGFNAAVLSRAAAAVSRRRRLRRRVLSFATVLGVVALGLGIWSADAAKDRVARRAALLEEHRRLVGELDEVRALADRRSLIPLGGDASTDLYLDLATVPAGSTASSVVQSTTLTRSQG